MFISRRAVHLSDGLRWIFWCSCAPSQGALLSSISHHVFTCYSQIRKDECIHISVSKLLIEEIDMFHEISPEIDFKGSYIAIANND